MKFLLRNHQRKIRFDLPLLRQVMEQAMPHCLARKGSGQAVLKNLESLEASILTDAAIGRVHDEFFYDPSPTDVITFPHGEILLGAGTIARQAQEVGHCVNREAALCLIHGLLHLQGYDDMDPKLRTRMHRRQETILQAVFPAGKGSKPSALPAEKKL
jgi:probable rRNA maturation factor